jgi:hypothetical protein
MVADGQSKNIGIISSWAIFRRTLNGDFVEHVSGMDSSHLERGFHTWTQSPVAISSRDAQRFESGPLRSTNCTAHGQLSELQR